MQPKIYQSRFLKNMLLISIKDNEPIDKALKRFKKKFERTGVLRELRGRSYFEKPSITRRHEVIKATYRDKMRREEANPVK